MSHANIRVGSVTLIVNDLKAMTAFYRKVIGLSVIEITRRSVRLGVGQTLLLELIHDPHAPLADRHGAGLFHIAFLLPDRASLGQWLRHAVESDIPLTGAADHLVSEALYLADPEGNGIEIYRDRPREEWSWHDGMVQMANRRLDLQELATSGSPRPWTGLPDGSSIGHVHLQVGDLQHADAFYQGTLQLDIVSRRPQASFYSSGGYHHHLAVNTWNSAGAGMRPALTTGLAVVELLVDDNALPVPQTLTDPWGTIIRLQGA
ncbi:VOC family protein [Paracoccus seriniphilus]|uniref:Catechol 2,3-dioxygenase n=1 Tax=Paracoccus seriniphilus TaxID=184748 RepID=A0A239PUX7_9RHOB|nr:VOC family protein [Paracoccus seriniphilus]WCR16525.1 VOC family protein [Paracoccus seriniphilus]SNT73732.1 catechol 2,3-dioxygenase [Paracoccus seriniphilus]